MEKNCLNCNSVFSTRETETKRGNGKFCSLSCSAKYYGKKTQAKPNVKCSFCGKEFHLANKRIKNSKSGFHFCCRGHKDEAQRSEHFKEMWPAHYGTGSRDYRRKALKKYGGRCQRCGYDKHIAAITVHHKDYNRKNDSISNLEILCANCHSVEHYGATGLQEVVI